MSINEIDTKFSSEFKNKSILIVIISIVSFAFQCFRYDFELYRSFISALVILIFSSFIGLMAMIVLNIYGNNRYYHYEEKSFFFYWWRIYLIMFAGGILSWLTFGNL